MPYSFVWFEPAVAQVQWRVSLLGFTPGLPEVFGVPEQLSNFEPPGVSFVFADADALVLADADAAAFALVCELLEACSSLLPWTLPLPWSSLPADTEADVEDEVVADVDCDAEIDDDSSDFFWAWPWSSAETETEAWAVTLVEDCSCAA